MLKTTPSVGALSIQTTTYPKAIPIPNSVLWRIYLGLEIFVNLFLGDPFNIYRRTRLYICTWNDSPDNYVSPSVLKYQVPSVRQALYKDWASRHRPFVYPKLKSWLIKEVRWSLLGLISWNTLWSYSSLVRWNLHGLTRRNSCVSDPVYCVKAFLV